MQAITPGSNWKDSYSVNGQCYCDSTFDHDADLLVVETPAGPKSVVEICQVIGPGPGAGSNPLYNDLQCGNGPPNSAVDEVLCPGRVDMGAAGCQIIGPTWNLERYFPAPETDSGANGTTDSTGTTPESGSGPDTGPGTDAGSDTTTGSDTGAENGTDTGTGTDTNTNTGTNTGSDVDTSAGTDTQTDAGAVTGDSSAVETAAHELTVLAGDLLFDFTDFTSKDDRWVLIDDQWVSNQTTDLPGFQARLDGSDSRNYLEVRPDTKVIESDPQTDDNVWTTPGAGPQIQLDIDFDQAGEYEVYIRMYSSSSFDDSISVAVDGQWSDTTGIHDTCAIHEVWTWSPCQDAEPITVSIQSAGVHTVQFAAMHDGVDIDQFLLRRLADPGVEPDLVKAVSVGKGVVFGAGVSIWFIASLLAGRLGCWRITCWRSV